MIQSNFLNSHDYLFDLFFSLIIYRITTTFDLKFEPCYEIRILSSIWVWVGCFGYFCGKQNPNYDVIFGTLQSNTKIEFYWIFESIFLFLKILSTLLNSENVLFVFLIEQKRLKWSNDHLQWVFRKPDVQLNVQLNNWIKYWTKWKILVVFAELFWHACI